jgi:XTP/dITP diphosphohydrolase
MFAGKEMSLHRPLVIATHNAGKLNEFRRLLSEFAVDIRSLRDFGPIPEAEEDGATFEQNAVKKARFTAKVLGLPALADDSGLEVGVLNGKPGVYSARYAGERATDRQNNQKLLEQMRGIQKREAAFVCVIAIAVPGGACLTYEGRCEGLIAEAPQGDHGFGYDPLFYYPPLKKTFAQLKTEEKNLVSHRGGAMAELRQEFDKVLIWLRQRLAEEPV